MKTRIVKLSPAMWPQLVPQAPAWVNGALLAVLMLAAVVFLPKTPDSLVAIGLGGAAAVGMVVDAQLLFSDAQAGTVTAVSTNIIDLGADRNIGIGEPLCVVICLDTALDRTTGDETYSVTVQTDDNAAFSSPATVVGPVALLLYAAGTKFIIAIPPDTLTERFLRLNYTTGGTTPIFTITAFLTPTKSAGAGENTYYADAINIG